MAKDFTQPEEGIAESGGFTDPVAAAPPPVVTEPPPVVQPEPVVPVAGPSVSDQVAEDLARARVQPIAQSLAAASKMDPNRHATVLEYADQMGLAPDLVDRNLEYFRGLAKYQDASQGADWATIVRDRPALANWLTNRDNAAISQDDLPQVVRLNDAFSAINQSEAKRAEAANNLPWIGAIGATLRKGEIDAVQMLAAIPALLTKSHLESLGLGNVPGLNPAAELIYSGEDLMRQEREVQATFKESTAQKLALPVVGLLGSPYNALPLVAGAKAAQSVIEISEVVRDAAALKAAAGAMGAQSAVSALGESLKARQEAGTTPAGQPILPTIGEVSHAGLQGALAYVMGTAGGLTGTLRSLRQATPTLAEVGNDVLKQAVVGGTQSSAAEFIRSAFDGKVPTPGELAMAYLNGGLGGGALAALNVPSAFAHTMGAQLADRMIEAHTAADGAAHLAQAAVALEASKTNERSQVRMADLMKEIVAASGQEATGKVYAQGGEWDAFWHKAGMDPEQVATAMTGDPKAYARAVATGGAIEIPQEAFLSKLAGTDHFAELLNKVSLGPGKPTLEQANETFKNFSADLQKLHESIKAEVDTGAGIADPSGEHVFQSIFEQRIKSGATTEVAKTEAKVWQHVMQGIARQYNETAKESGAKPVNASDLFNSLRLKIHRELPNVLKGTDAAVKIEPVLNELRQARAAQEGKAGGKRPADVLDALKEIGGIAPKDESTGGEYDSKPASFPTKGSNKPDQAAKQLESMGYGDGTVNGLWKAVEAAQAARKFFKEESARGAQPVHLPQHLKQFDEALRLAGIDIAAHPTNETIFQTIRDRIAEGVTKAVGIPQEPGALEESKAPVTFEQGARLNAPEGGSLHKSDLMEQWRRAHGERAPDESSQEWRDLVVASRIVDEARGLSFAQGERGNVTFGDLGTVIKLFQSEDLSTFSHESAHVWLNAYGSLAERPDAPEAMKGEWSKILKWLEVDSFAKIGTKEHEQWAESWEHYLREGKAPSAELRSAFSRIKAWMLQVYSDIKAIYRSTGGKIKLSDEMRGVFDRLLASRDEINAANERDSADPLFMTAEQAGMSDAKFAAYQKRALAERQQRQDILERKLVGAFLKEQTKLYQNDRENVREQVASEMNDRKDLAAVALLQRGRLPDGTVLLGPAIKLDRAELAKVFGEDNLEHLPGSGDKRANQNNRGPMVYAKEGGLPIDVAAEALGFSSGSELFHTLVNAPDIAKTIDGITDERMLLRYPDPMKDGTIAEKVIQATHEKESRAEVLDDEAQALAARIKASATPRQVIKTMARETIAKMRAIDVRPEVYRVAEAKAGREAFESAAKGEYEKALVAKQRQQINHELCKAAAEAKADAVKMREHWVSLTKPAAQERIGKAGGWQWTVTRPDGMQMHLPTEESARSMAEQTDGATWARTSSYVDSINKVLAGVELTRVSGDNLARREALAQFEMDQNALGIPVDIPLDVLRAANVKNWRQLTMEEMHGIDDAVRNIEHAALGLRKAMAEQKAKTFAELQATMGAAIVEHSKGPRKDQHGSSLTSAFTGPMERFADWNTRVTDLIYRMNGHKEGGDFFWNWQHPLNQAGDRQGEMEAKSALAMNEALDVWNKSGPLKSIGINNPEWIPEIKLSLNKLSQIVFACHYGNLGNRQRLLEGMKIDETQARAVLDKLDKADWTFVNTIIKQIGSYRSEAFALEQRVHGVAPKAVEPAPFMTKYGEQPGGYFPIKYDRRLSGRPSHESPEAEAEAMLGGHGAGSAMTEHGHLKARGEGNGDPLDLNFDIIGRHLNSVIKDLAQRETLMSLNRLLQSPEFKNTLQAHWGVNAWTMLQQQLMSVARGPIGTDTGMEKALGFFRTGANAARRAFAVAYAVKQLPGMVAAIPRLGLGNVLRAIGPAFSPAAHKFADEHSTALRLRNQEHNKSLGEGAKRTSPFAARGPMERLAYLFASKAWKIVDTHAWYAGFNKAMQMPEVGGNQTKAAAIADQILNDTQGGFLPKDQPQILRGGELSKVFTNNMSWANANGMLMLNSLYRFADKGGFRSLEATAHMASDMAMYVVVAPALYLLVSDALDGAIDDWKDPKEAAKKVAKEGAYTVLGSAPLLRELSNALTEGRRADVLSGASGLGEVINLGAAIRRDLADDTSGASRTTLRGAAKVGGIVTHFPAWQVLRMLDGWTYAEEHGQNPILPTLLGRQAGKH